jgi:DivIVA domain-containing protein
MALTPEDVVNKRFQPTKFREGYDQDEVDDFLDEIVVELRRLNQENDELRKKLADATGGQQKNTAVPAPVAASTKTEAVKDETKAEAKAEASKAQPQAAEPKAEESQAEAAKPEAPRAEESRTGSSKAAPAAAAAAPAAQSAHTATAESAAGVLAMAQKLHDEYVNAGIEQRDKIIAEAQTEANGLINDAQEKSRKTLGALEQQKAVLERKVEQLRGFERDYRSRLKAYIEGQLRDLDARGTVVTETASS